MKIGIIVYSQTGNTLSVAEKVKNRLSSKGHSVQLERVTVVGERTPQTKTFELKDRPDVASYDAIVFASYVEAFSLCAVMKTYLQGIGSLSSKRVACLITQQFPYPWMGGNRAAKQLARLCSARGAQVRQSAVVNWATSKREQTTAAAVQRLGDAF